MLLDQTNVGNARIVAKCSFGCDIHVANLLVNCVILMLLDTCRSDVSVFICPFFSLTSLSSQSTCTCSTVPYPLAYPDLPQPSTHRQAVVNAFVYVHQTMYQADSRLLKRGGHHTSPLPGLYQPLNVCQFWGRVHVYDKWGKREEGGVMTWERGTGGGGYDMGMDAL